MRLDHLLSMENGRQLALGLEQIRPDILNGKNPKGYDEIRSFKGNFLLFDFEGLSSKRIQPKPEGVWGCSSAGRAPALQAGGHGFESHHLHQRRKDGERRYTEITIWAHSSGG